MVDFHAPKLTVNCMVRNEGLTIWEALMSTVPYCEAAVVYDTGSTDKTVEIIRDVMNRLPGKINLIQKPHPDLTVWGERMKFYPSVSLGGVRNEMQALTKTDIILTVDADEVYPKAAMKNVVEAVNAMPAHVDCIYVPLYWIGKTAFHICTSAAPGIYFLTGRVFRNRKGYEHRGVFPGECAHFDGVIPRPGLRNCTQLSQEGTVPRLHHYEMTTKPWRRNVMNQYLISEKEVPEVLFDREAAVGPGLLSMARAGKLMAIPPHIVAARM